MQRTRGTRAMNRAAAGGYAFRDHLPTIAVRVGVFALALVAATRYIRWEESGWIVAGLLAASGILALTAARPVLAWSGAWFGFLTLRAWADDVGLPDQADALIAIDRLLGLGATPTERLQAAIFTPGAPTPFDHSLTLVHASYFAIPHLAALLLWWRDARGAGSGLPRVRRYLLAVLLVMAVGIAGHVLLPAQPPWLAAAQDDRDLSVVRVADGGEELSAQQAQSGEIYGVFVDANTVAVMPSLHMAITLVMALALWSLDRRLGVVALLYSAAMGFALIYLGEHYLIDVLAGVAAALLAWWATRRWAQAYLTLDS
jgi:membrane-associated phospholipid phosphatase